MLNILAGSYGLPPSANLPFKHNMHFSINLLLKFLFEKTNAINWFSIVLLGLQFIASVCISYLIYVYNKSRNANIYVVILFVIFMIYMLMYLTTSTTSLVMGIAGITMLWHVYKDTKITYKHLIGPLLIIIASLIRIHTLFLIIVVSLPFFFLISTWKMRIVAFSGIAITFLIIYLLSVLQQVYYERNYPNWNVEEEYRQAKYDYINYYRDTTVSSLGQWKLEVRMAEKCLFFDTNFLSKNKVEQLVNVARSSVPLGILVKFSTWKWLLINNRLFFLSVILFLIFFRYSKVSYLLLFTSIGIAVLEIIYLVAFRKLPDFVIPGIFFTIVLFAILIKTDIRYKHQPLRFLNVLFVLMTLSWGVVRAYKINQQNLSAYTSFKKIYRELKGQPDKLFVCFIDDIKNVRCFDSPKDFPFNNILFLDHPLGIHKKGILNNFGLTGIHEFPSNRNVLFAGADESLFVEYYRKAYGQSVYFSDPLTSFRYSTVKRLFLR